MLENQSKTFLTSNSTKSSNQDGTPTPDINAVNSQASSKYSKISPIPKPDFSSIEKKESSFALKQKGSYKKPKSIVPESPMKSPNQRIFTPVKFNLDNNNNINNLNGISNQSTCRKLTFAEKIAEEENGSKSPKGEEKFIESFRQNNNNNNYEGLFFDKNEEEEVRNTMFNDFIENTKNNKMNLEFFSGSNKHKSQNFNHNHPQDISMNNDILYPSLFNDDDADINYTKNNQNHSNNLNGEIKGFSCWDHISDERNIRKYEEKNYEINTLGDNSNTFSLKFSKNDIGNDKIDEGIYSYEKTGKNFNFSINNYSSDNNNNYNFNQLFNLHNVDIHTNLEKQTPDYSEKINTMNNHNNTYSISDINEINSQNTQTDSKFEREFLIIKTIEAGTFGIVYKCLNKVDNQIYAVKKSKKYSSISDFNSIQNLIHDININRSDIFANFCVNTKETWLEKEFHEHTLTDDHLYISQDFCLFGDLLNYLEKLEQINYTSTVQNLEKFFILNENFYWDLIFEMMSGIHFLHKCGFVHLDVKPGNFLVTDNGGVKIGDFGLTKKIKEIHIGEDLNEGDSSYLAPEFFGDAKKKFIINSKCDVFSLGLSILEIVCRVEIPQNGILWEEIRSKNFKIPEEFMKNSNIKISERMLRLIMDMLIIDPYKRPDLIEIFENDYYEEIYKRYNSLLNGCYIRSFSPVEILKKEHSMDFDMGVDGIAKIYYAKRSNSYKIMEELI